jgi:putative ABC transport system permease protein
VSDLLKDLRLGGRLLVKSPGYSVVVAFTLALAIGANSIIFGFTDLLLIRPLPFGDPSGVTFLYGVNPQRGVDRARTSLPDFMDWRARTTAFAQMAAFGGGAYTLTGQGEPLRVSALRATANLFGLWQLAPVAGRTFLPHEDRPGAAKVAVLSHHFWIGHFNGTSDVIGRSLVLNGEPYTVVGVLTPAIEIGSFESIDLWVPLTLDASGARRDDRALRVTALLKPGGSFNEASAEMLALARGLEQDHPETNAGWSARPLKLRDAIVGPDTWQILALLTIVVAFVLVVACANIANMMLARATARQKEMAVRIALGASRRRLLQQIVTESLLLGLAGGVLGVAVTGAGIRAIQATSNDYFFRQLMVGRHLLAFAFALSMLTPLLFSLLPALHASRADLNEALKGAGYRTSGGPKGRRSRAVLVVSQLALALMLLVVASLAARSVAAIEHEPPGVQTANLLTVQIQLESPKYREVQHAVPFTDQVIERLAALPGVRAAAAMTVLPLVASEPTIRFQIAGRPKPAPKDTPWASAVAITPEYLRVFDLRLRDGREFSRGDDGAAPRVALVSREAVRRFWPNGSPVGAHIDLVGEPATAATATAIEIVGIVDDVKSADPTEPAPPRIYRPLAQSPDRGVALVVRSAGDPTALAPAVRDVLRHVDPDLAISQIRRLDQIVREQFAENYVLVGLFASSALLALVLAGTGVYGVTAYGVSQRTQEIGIRMALGASRHSVLSLVLGQNGRLVVIGALIGVAGGAMLGRAMRSILYRVGPDDPVTFATVISVLTAVAFVASYLPARRASHIDPLTALRHE